MNKKIKLLLLIVSISFSTFSQTRDSIEEQKIEEVKITAYRIKSDLGKIPQQIKIISAKEFTSVPSRGFDEILKKMTAVDIIQYQGFNSVIGMRGFAPSGFGKANTLILVDGIPYGTSNLSTINLENIQQIEVLKGPYSAFFGSDAMAGVINLTTRQSKDKLSGNAYLSYGSFNTYKLDFRIGGNITKKLNFDLYANSMAQNDNYTTGNQNLLKLTDEEKVVMEEKSYGKEYQHSTYTKYNVGTRLGFEFSKDWNIRADLSYWLAKDIENNGNFWASYPGQLQDINRWSQSISLEGKEGKHQLRFSPHFSSENNLFYSDLSDTAYKNQESTLQTYGFILQDAIDLGIINFILGADNLSRKNTSKIWSALEVESIPYQPDYINTSTGLYFQLNVVLLDQKLNVSVGERYDYIKFKLFETDLLENQAAEEVYQTFNPNFGFQYRFLDGFKAHAAGGTAFVAPDAFKMAGSYTSNFGSYKGNPELEPESSFTYDFGLSYADKKSGLDADISYFSTIYENIIGYDFSDPAFTSFKNEDNAKMSGLELEAAYDFGSLNNYSYHLKLYASYTYLLNSTVNVDSVKMDMKYVRKSKGSFGVDFSSKNGLSARLNARYIGERYEDNWLYSFDWTTWEKIPFVDANGQEIRPSLINEDIIQFPDHLVFDLNISYLIKKKYQVGFSVENLFDENYSEKDMYYMPGRSFMASLNLKF